LDSYRSEIDELARQHGPAYRRNVVVGLMMGVFPIIMSGTIINVAIPSIQTFFAAGHLEAQVLASSFLAATTASLLLSGGLIGRLGVRTTFHWMIWGFLVSSLLAALLPSEGLALLALLRVIQGFVAGVAQSLALLVMVAIFPPEQRGRAISAYGLGIVLSPTVGPFVGGFLVSMFGWQSIFLFSLPFSAASLFLAARLLPKTAPADLPRRIRSLPAVYMACFIAGLTGAFLLWLNKPMLAQAFALLGIAGLGLFLRDQARASEQMLNFALLRRPGVLAAAMISFTYGAGMYGSTYLIPVFLQDLGGRSSWEAGTVLLPGGIVLGVALYLGGILTDRFQVRWILFAGLVAFVASSGAFLTVLASVSLPLVIAFTIVGRIGLGLTIPSLNAGATRMAPESFASTVTVMVNYFRQLGGTVGVGVVGLLLEFSGHAPHPGSRMDPYWDAFFAMTISFLPALLAVYWMRPLPSRGER
jgi:DHA2 family multidrug resistance protein